MVHRRNFGSADFCSTALHRSFPIGFRAMDIQAAGEMDVAIAVGSLSEAEHQGQMPLGVIVYVALAAAAQALWLGAIGWWLLNLF
jgi:hypothetical protein